ncbi:helix-turn-helix domain-containing protein [Amycolatopsis deserti]
MARYEAGWPPARIAEQLGVAHSPVCKWVTRHREEGEAGLADRACARTTARPACPRKPKPRSWHCWAW